MTDYTLKFPDEATATTVLEPFELTHSIDLVGTLHRYTGKMIVSDGIEYPEMAPIPGWHVNVRGPEALELNPYVIKVKTPARVWA